MNGFITGYHVTTRQKLTRLATSASLDYRIAKIEITIIP